MQPNQRLYEREVRHQVGLRRLSSATLRKINSLLIRLDDDLEERIRRLSLDPNRKAASEAQIQRLLASWAAKRQEVVDALEAVVGSDMEVLGLYERDFNTAGLRSAAAGVGFNVATDASVIAAVNSQPFQGRFLREWIEGLDATIAALVRDQLRIGYLEGEGIPALVKRIRGTRSRGYQDGILEVSRRSATRIVRTAMTHTANAASQITYEAASESVQGVRYTAILDGRTSLVCAGLDGKVFPIDSGPRPPQHPNCRSTTAAVIKGAPSFSRETYQAWLKRQPRDVQDEVLGPSRAKLFREGVAVERFTDRKGEAWDLDELKTRENGAWMHAGLEDD